MVKQTEFIKHITANLLIDTTTFLVYIRTQFLEMVIYLVTFIEKIVAPTSKLEMAFFTIQNRITQKFSHVF